MQQPEFITETESELISSRIEAQTKATPMIPRDISPELSSLVSAPPNKSPPSSGEPTHLDPTRETVFGLPLPCTDINQDTRGHCPGFEIGESPKRTSGAENKPQSDFTLPGSECLTENRRTVAIIIPRDDTGRRYLSDGSFVITSPSTIEIFRESLRELKPAQELWLFHIFYTNREGRPLIGPQLVSENELYEPLLDSRFHRVAVFQFPFRKEWDGKHTYHSMIQTGESVMNPFKDMDFYLFDTKNWHPRSLQDALAQIADRAYSAEGLTSERVADELVPSCPERLWRTGVQSGGRISSLPEICEPSVVQHLQPQDNGIISRQPMQSDPEDLVEPDFGYPSASACHRSFTLAVQPDSYNGFRPRGGNYYESLTYPVDTQMRRNASLGIIIKDYGYSQGSQKLYVNRLGAEKDAGLIYDISRKFCCYNDNICVHNEKGPVSKQEIQNYIQNFIHEDSERSMTWGELQNLFLFVSSHGNQGGIVTSRLETMPLAELVQPLLDICERLNLIYQPCRGDVLLRTPGVPRLRGVSLPADDTAGCSLPPAMTNLSAMLASLPGFKNSWHCEKNGSFMFHSLSQVVHAPDMAGTLSNMMKLTELTAVKLWETFPDYKDEAPMQYIMRGHCSIRIAESNFPLHQEPAIPEVLRQGFTLRLRKD